MKTVVQFLLGVCALLAPLNAQDDRALLNKLMDEDSDVVNIIALYDNDIRTAMFVAAGSSAVVVRLSDVQQRSNTAFKNALNAYSKEDQARVWNITRYESLLTRLVAGGRKDSSALSRIVADFPEEVRSDARDIASRKPELLASVEAIRRDFETTSSQVLASNPESVVSSFRTLLKNPEALGVLNENMRTTVLLGDLYKRNSELVNQRFKDLNAGLVNRKAKDLEEWKAKVQDDPDAQNELQKSAQEFAEENSLSSDVQPRSQQVAYQAVYTPYPYWSGYPWWYETPYWYPQPAWYHCGFYYASNQIVWFGTPSWYFMRWHFRHSRHFSLYPHITNCYLDYYCYGPHRYWARSGFEVRRWFGINRSQFPSDFQSNRPLRIERIREVGQNTGGRQRPINTVPQPGGRTRELNRPSAPTPSWGRQRTPEKADDGSSRRSEPIRPSTPRSAPAPTPDTRREIPGSDRVRPAPERTAPRTEQPASQPRIPSSPRMNPAPARTPSPSPGVKPAPSPTPAPAPQTPSTKPR